MNFESFIGNQGIKEHLFTALKGNRLPKAFIFYGPEGIGKASMALLLAKALNCSSFNGDICDKCNSCYKIEKRIHSDVQIFHPEGKEISIEQMRLLANQINLKPLEGKFKVFIIDPAEQMSAEAANALLKTLEEPPPNSLIVLITQNLTALLPTIRSRCQLLHFAAIPSNELKKALIESFQFEPEEALSLAHLSAGSLGSALNINLNESYEKRKRELVFLQSLSTREEFGIILERIDELKGKEKIDELLQILYSITRDLLVLSLTNDISLLINIDLEEELKACLKRFTIEIILSIMSEIHYTIKAIEENVNRKVALEALFFRIIYFFRKEDDNETK
jgi:DNA polymerase-3 subunit delta'